MIVITFSHKEDTGINVVKAALEKLKPFFEQQSIGTVKNEKARADKIFSKCRKLSQGGNRIDALLILRSSLSNDESLKLSYVPRTLPAELNSFIEDLKLSKAKSKPELIELNKTDFPIQLKTLGQFAPQTLLLEFSFNKNNPFDYDLRKFRNKKHSESLKKSLSNLKKFLSDLESHSKKKAASVSRKRSKEVAEVSSALEDLEKELISSRKPIDAEQDRSKKEQLMAEWRKNGSDQMISKFKEIVWPKLAEKSPFTLEEDENIDAAGRSLLIRTSGRILADVFLSGTGEFEIMMRSPMQKMSLITFYEKLCKNSLPEQWKEKFGISFLRNKAVRAR